MGKVAYIIPGFTESNKQIGYKQISSLFRAKGIKPIPVDINWKYRVMSDYIDEFIKKYNKSNGKEVYVLGFSYGAMISFISSPLIKPKMQILCSLSPFFKEDLSKGVRKRWIKYIGRRRFEDHKKYSFNELAKKTSGKTILFLGSKELKIVKNRALDANKKLGNCNLIVIKNAKHKIAQKEYQNALKELISNLD